MKTLADIESQLRLELIHWAGRQAQDIHTRFYLYFLASTPEHTGGIIIKSSPSVNPDYELACPDAIRRDCTVDQNMALLRPVVRRLPVLDF